MERADLGGFVARVLARLRSLGARHLGLLPQGRRAPLEQRELELGRVLLCLCDAPRQTIGPVFGVCDAAAAAAFALIEGRLQLVHAPTQHQLLLQQDAEVTRVGGASRRRLGLQIVGKASNILLILPPRFGRLFLREGSGRRQWSTWRRFDDLALWARPWCEAEAGRAAASCGLRSLTSGDCTGWCRARASPRRLLALPKGWPIGHGHHIEGRPQPSVGRL